MSRTVEVGSRTDQFVGFFVSPLSKFSSKHSNVVSSHASKSSKQSLTPVSSHASKNRKQWTNASKYDQAENGVTVNKHSMNVRTPVSSHMHIRPLQEGVGVM
jgi:hypothetical protein